jgi:uncharacterized protein YndB with AHSA1/START domain
MNKTEFKIEPGKLDFTTIREFDAPRERVFKIYTDPKLIPLWWGPRDLTTTVQPAEIQTGSSWRYVQVDQQGNTFAFHGVFHEVTAPERVIQTFEFEGLPEKGHVLLETVLFEELPGNRTRLVAQDVFQSVADRDGMLESGMESGTVESMDRLEELLEKVAQRV